MGSVYIVTAGTYSSYHIVDVFATEDQANAFVDKLKRRYGDSYEYEDITVDKYDVHDSESDVLTEWPDDEVLEVFYEYNTNELSQVHIESATDVIDHRRGFVEEIGHYHNGARWFKFYIPISTIPDGKKQYYEDKLESNPQLLKIAQDRYAQCKAYLAEKEPEPSRIIEPKKCEYLKATGVCDGIFTVLCGYQSSGRCTHPNCTKA